MIKYIRTNLKFFNVSLLLNSGFFRWEELNLPKKKPFPVPDWAPNYLSDHLHALHPNLLLKSPSNLKTHSPFRGFPSRAPAPLSYIWPCYPLWLSSVLSLGHLGVWAPGYPIPVHFSSSLTLLLQLNPRWIPLADQSVVVIHIDVVNVLPAS